MGEEEVREDTEHREIRSELVRGLEYMAKGEFGLAETTYSLALEKAVATEGEESELTQKILGFLAKSCASQGKHKMAALMYERLLLALDKNQVEGISVQLELIAAYTALERNDEADILRGEISLAFKNLPLSKVY